MARRSYDRMYKEMDAKDYEKSIETPIEEAKEEKIPELTAEVEVIKEDVKKEVKKQSITGTVIGGSLNVRTAPNGDIISSIKDGTKVVIVDESNPEWFKIESPEGYVMKKFVRI